VTTGVKQPFFLMLATVPTPSEPPVYIPKHDRGTIHEDLFVSHSTLAYRLDVDRLSHMNFSDKGFFFDTSDRLLELFHLRRDAAETIRLASTYAQAFFGQYLSDVQSPAHELDHPLDSGMRLKLHQNTFDAPR